MEKTTKTLSEWWMEAGRYRRLFIFRQNIHSNKQEGGNGARKRPKPRKKQDLDQKRSG